jgi:hypothetical protein
VLFEPHDGEGRRLAVLPLQVREVAAPQPPDERLEHLDPHALHSQRGQQPGNVGGQRLVENQGHHRVRAEASRSQVTEVGDAVQGDGRLARSRPPVDDHDARFRAGDQIELLGIEHPRDGPEQPVFSLRIRDGGPPTQLLHPQVQGLHGAGPDGAPFSPLQAGRCLAQLGPAVVGELIGALHALDPHQPPLQDHQPPMGEDRPFHRPLPELLLV